MDLNEYSFISSLGYCAVFLIPFLLLQRKVHFEIQAIFMLITRRPNITTVLFSLFFLPGVVVHELSHFIFARLTGVNTGGFSILPKQLGNGRLQLGYVETESTDFLRDSLIGAAPLITGGLLVIYVAQTRLNLNLLFDGVPTENLWISLGIIFNSTDFWIWFYLLFTVSSMMLPSASDRKAWLPFAVVFLILVVIGIIVGIGPWLQNNIAPIVQIGLRSLAAVFLFSSMIHFAILVPLILLRNIISRLLGLHIRS